ncbi:MAG TPA: nickel pincer cofactor biosynthesis protein LarB [Pirellulaceae bacterium]|nr:nickel pincer cofactor biosynthesis protein LarB [Pirellulaceae bacterium]
MSQPLTEPFTLDLDRARRCGFPEVVFGEGKCVITLASIFQRLLDDGMEVLATRIAREKSDELLKMFPRGKYNERAKTFRLVADERRSEAKCGRVVVVTAGTSDLPIAEEALETLDWMNVSVSIVHDVGVAGPHRLPAKLDQLRGCDAIVVVAGMEGALPSVVGGYVDCPIIAVPTSVGYGANLGGISALLSMLNSCAANVTVVNIDAGFKGGYVAGLIASRAGQGRGEQDGEASRGVEGKPAGRTSDGETDG